MARPSRAVISRAPTLDDVARAAGLSSMTVSRALNTPDQVRPETVKKVLAAVKATGYIPNALAGGLASRRSKLVAVLVSRNSAQESILRFKNVRPIRFCPNR